MQIMQTYIQFMQTYGANDKVKKEMVIAPPATSRHTNHRCGCFLPDLTRFTVYRCERTGRATIAGRSFCSLQNRGAL